MMVRIFRIFAEIEMTLQVPYLQAVQLGIQTYKGAVAV